jgi:hypothetical protein
MAWMSGEVEVEILHWQYLAQAASRGAAFHADHGTERRLSQARDRPLADRA